MINSSLEDRLGYVFSNPQLLATALTHSSAANEKGQNRIKDNERLEFLGDSVLSLIISKYLYESMAHIKEGHLSKFRAIIVCEKSLAHSAEAIRLGEEIVLGKGEEQTGGRRRPSILADAMEAVIGAIYLDGGLEAAGDFVITVFKPTIEKALAGMLTQDYKTELQESLQVNRVPSINYLIDDEEGPDHDKTFYISVWDGGKKLGSGMGKTKKEAEQNAAKAALEGMSIVL